MSNSRINSDVATRSLVDGEAWLSVATALMVAVTFIWALSAAGFLLGFAIGRWQSICGLLPAALVLWRLNRDLRSRWLSALALLSVTFASIGISAVTLDNSYDGWLYHQPAVIALSHGWNPVAEPVFGDWWAAHAGAFGYPAGAPAVDILWTTVYPKALWILGAQTLAWGLPLDSGKYPGMLLILIAAAVAFRALRLRRVERHWAYALSALAALNPVSVIQATTYYTDGPLGSCLAILIFSLLSYDLTRTRVDLVLALCAALIACNLKFTGPVYSALIVVPILIWWLFRGRIAWQHWLIAAAAASIMLVASINPYLTNLRAFGSAIYPLNQADLMEDQMSAAFLQKNRFEKLLVSLTFSNQGDHFAGLPERDESSFTSPFQSRGLGEFKNFVRTCDLRFGGFGPLFAAALALALVICGLINRGFRRDIALCLVAGGVLASIVVNPEMWWARYVPQLWLVPVLVAACALQMRIAVSIVPVILLIMGSTSLIAVVGRSIIIAGATMSYDQTLKTIGDATLRVDPSSNEAAFLPALTYRLHERGAGFLWAGGECTHPMSLVVVNGCSGGRPGGEGR